MLNQTEALELAPYRIRVNAMATGPIEWDLSRNDIANPEFEERRMARNPLKGLPEDIVGAVIFLASDLDARLVTGASLLMDVGQTIWDA